MEPSIGPPQAAYPLLANRKGPEQPQIVPLDEELTCYCDCPPRVDANGKKVTWCCSPICWSAFVIPLQLMTMTAWVAHLALGGDSVFGGPIVLGIVGNLLCILPVFPLLFIPFVLKCFYPEHLTPQRLIQLSLISTLLTATETIYFVCYMMLYITFRVNENNKDKKNDIPFVPLIPAFAISALQCAFTIIIWYQRRAWRLRAEIEASKALKTPSIN